MSDSGIVTAISNLDYDAFETELTNWIAFGNDINSLLVSNEGNALHYLIRSSIYQISQPIRRTVAILNHRCEILTQMCKLLITRGINVDHRNSHQMTPLTYLILQPYDTWTREYRWQKLCIDLIHSGANTNIEDEHILIQCTQANYIDVCSLLLSKGFDINIRDSDGNTPLIYATDSGKINIAKLLISAGADVTLCNNSLFNPLHHACNIISNLAVEVCQMILERNSSQEFLDAEPNNGKSALWYSLLRDNTTITDLLIDKGASLDKNLDHPYIQAYVLKREIAEQKRIIEEQKRIIAILTGKIKNLWWSPGPGYEEAMLRCKSGIDTKMNIGEWNEKMDPEKSLNEFLDCSERKMCK